MKLRCYTLHSSHLAPCLFFLVVFASLSHTPLSRLHFLRYRIKCREREALALEFETTEKERNELVQQLTRLKRYQRYLEQTVGIREGKD